MHSQIFYFILNDTFISPQAPTQEKARDFLRMTMINMTLDSEPLKRKSAPNGDSSPNKATNDNEEKSIGSQPSGDDEEAAQFVANHLDSDSDSDKVNQKHTSITRIHNHLPQTANHSHTLPITVTGS